MKYFFPEKDFTWEELDKISDKPKDKWTWICAALVELKKMGLIVKNYSNFDYSLFAIDGYDYLRKKYTKEVAERQIEMGDIKSEMENAKEMLKEGIYEKMDFPFETVVNWFNEGYVILMNLGVQMCKKNMERNMSILRFFGFPFFLDNLQFIMIKSDTPGDIMES